MSLSELQELVMDREAWRAAIHAVAKSQTWLSDWTELKHYSVPGIVLRAPCVLFLLIHTVILWGRYYFPGKDWRQEKWMTEDEMVGWHHQLDGLEFEQAPGDGEGQESLACCSPWGVKESDMTEWLNWTGWAQAGWETIRQSSLKIPLSSSQWAILYILLPWFPHSLRRSSTTPRGYGDYLPGSTGSVR